MSTSLNERMDFDHPVQVHPDGGVTDVPHGRLYAPTLLDGELDSTDWEFASHGYTGQYGVGNSPIMHNCESIGGRLERDILATPGIYLTVVANWSPDPELGDDEDTYTGEGWAVCRYVG